MSYATLEQVLHLPVEHSGLPVGGEPHTVVVRRAEDVRQPSGDLQDARSQHGHDQQLRAAGVHIGQRAPHRNLLEQQDQIDAMADEAEPPGWLTCPVLGGLRPEGDRG